MSATAVETTVSPFLGNTVLTTTTESLDNVELGGGGYFRLQLSLEAKNIHLRKNCTQSHSNAQAYAEIKLLSNDEYLGRTESLAPEYNSIIWSRPIYFPDYKTGEQPHVQVSVYQGSSDSDSTDDDKSLLLLGQCIINIYQVLEKNKSCQGLDVKFDTNRGSVTMYAHDSFTSLHNFHDDSTKTGVHTTHRRYMTLQFRALSVKNIEGGILSLGLGRSDPFFTIQKKHHRDNGAVRWQRVYKSEAIMNHANPLWKEFILHMDDLCDDDLNRELKFELWDYEASGKHRRIGEVECPVHELMTRVSKMGNADREYSLHFKDVSGKNVMGELIILQAEIKVFK